MDDLGYDPTYWEDDVGTFVGKYLFEEGVYGIVCRPTAGTYVGASSTVGIRIANHVQLLRKGNHTTEKLQNDFDDWGLEHFSFCIIDRSKESGHNVWIMEKEASRLVADVIGEDRFYCPFNLVSFQEWHSSNRRAKKSVEEESQPESVETCSEVEEGLPGVKETPRPPIVKSAKAKIVNPIKLIPLHMGRALREGNRIEQARLLEEREKRKQEVKKQKLIEALEAETLKWDILRLTKRLRHEMKLTWEQITLKINQSLGLNYRLRYYLVLWDDFKHLLIPPSTREADRSDRSHNSVR